MIEIILSSGYSRWLAACFCPSIAELLIRDRTCSNQLMESNLFEKLVVEVRRYQNKEFLKAAMAVCALSAYADDEVSFAERYSIDHAIENELGRVRAPTMNPMQAITC